ncbi:MAG: serine--tRNA ligase [Spirochaetes bacterium]|nr:serine--tRNA ligase [Spirochaetota bacterium]
MLDYRFIKENLRDVKENVKNRRVDADPELVAELYDERNGLIHDIEDLRKRRNENASGMKRKLSSDEREKLIEEGKKLKTRISGLEKELERVKDKLYIEALKIPNMSHPDAPLGRGEEDNREIKHWGSVPGFDFTPKDHVEIGKALDIVDFDTATKVSGQKFYYLKNEGVYLELALVRYAFDILRDEEFVLMITPDIAKDDIASGVGFNPRGSESNIYHIENTQTCLVGTAEITLGGYYANSFMDPESLPVKMAGLSHCFRKEAGAAGQFSRGLYRVHQFTKVEMFVYSHPEESGRMHEYLLGIEEKIFRGLNLPYRIVDTCTGELGGPAYRKYDVEAWMPGRGEKGGWGEVTSASNCTDYQARRLGIKLKEKGKKIFVHMLNGTAIAVSRAIVAILENYQQKDGSVRIPSALTEYTGFTEIQPKN